MLLLYIFLDCHDGIFWGKYFSWWNIWEYCIWLQYKNWQAGRAYLRPFRQGSQGKPEELRTYQIITTEPKVQIFKNKGKIDFYSLEFSDTAFFHALHNSGCLC